MDAVPQRATELYEDACRHCVKPFVRLRELACRIGQMQLLRRQIQHLLRFRAKLDSGNLFNALDAANRAVLGDVKRHFATASDLDDDKNDSSVAASSAPAENADSGDNGIKSEAGEASSSNSKVN